MRWDKKNLDLFSTECGVYLMKNSDDRVIYVGKAKNIQTRIKQYFIPGRDGRPMVPFLTEQIEHIDTILVPTEREALFLENTLIKKHQPKFNAILKDDKTFISLMINIQHKWPMLKLIRRKGHSPSKALYFGPYTSAYAARQTLDLLTQIFPLRQCSDEELKRRTRPCLLYSIKRCIAPCVERCTKEEYDHLVNGVIQFLKGEDKTILKNLYKEMELAAEKLEFEQAAAYLQTIRQIEHVVTSDPLIMRATRKDADVLAFHRDSNEVIIAKLIFREGKMVGSDHFSFSQVAENDEELMESFLIQHYHDNKYLPYEILLPNPLTNIEALQEILHPCHLIVPQKGDKKALVELAIKNAAATFKQEKKINELQEQRLLDLAETCNLVRYPKRIECFDISHFSGAYPVASMIAFTEGKLDRKRKRLFHIKDIVKGDDYGAMRQVLSRRLLRAKEERDLPDLIMIDGGKGHLKLSLEVLQELDIASVDAIAFAKEGGRHDKGMTKEQIFLPHQSHPILLEKNSPLLFLLQQIRDEAHAAALSFHRKKRKKGLITTSLDKIKGIGPIKRQHLLRHFGSVERIQKATLEELIQVPGITTKDGERVIHFFSHIPQ